MSHQDRSRGGGHRYAATEVRRREFMTQETAVSKYGMKQHISISSFKSQGYDMRALEDAVHRHKKHYDLSSKGLDLFVEQRETAGGKPAFGIRTVKADGSPLPTSGIQSLSIALKGAAEDVKANISVCALFEEKRGLFGLVPIKYPNNKARTHLDKPGQPDHRSSSSDKLARITQSKDTSVLMTHSMDMAGVETEMQEVPAQAKLAGTKGSIDPTLLQQLEQLRDEVQHLRSRVGMLESLALSVPPAVKRGLHCPHHHNHSTHGPARSQHGQGARSRHHPN